jgi:hypothetical protein
MDPSPLSLTCELLGALSLMPNVTDWMPIGSPGNLTGQSYPVDPVDDLQVSTHSPQSR